MEVKTLDKVSGAWIERGQAPYMRMAVKAEYDFGAISSRIKKPIILGVRTGVLSSTQGQAASVYRVLCEAFGLKYVCASKNGGHMYTNFSHQKFYESCEALAGLTRTRGGRYVHQYKSRIVSHNWRAKDESTRNVFEETIGFADKERREEAIDFLCSGGILTQTWIDHNPI